MRRGHLLGTIKIRLWGLVWACGGGGGGRVGTGPDIDRLSVHTNNWTLHPNINQLMVRTRPAHLVTMPGIHPCNIQTLRTRLGIHTGACVSELRLAFVQHQPVERVHSGFALRSCAQPQSGINRWSVHAASHFATAPGSYLTSTG